MEKKVLVNDMLFDDNILDIDYEYCYDYPFLVGVATAKKEDKKYNVYFSDERNSIYILKKTYTFNEAILFARKMYKGMISYYNGMTETNKKVRIKTNEKNKN